MTGVFVGLVLRLGIGAGNFDSGAMVMKNRAIMTDQKWIPMLPKIVVLLFLLTIGGAARADGAMTLDFSFKGLEGCKSLFPNPEIRLKNVPQATARVYITLTRGDRELGGQEARITKNSIVPAKSVTTFAPCPAGIYTYSALAKAQDGQPLAVAHQSRTFPSDELKPDGEADLPENRDGRRAPPSSK
jgi:hypothetical protein